MPMRPPPMNKTPVANVVTRKQTLHGIPSPIPVFLPRPQGDARRDSYPEPESYASGQTGAILLENARLRSQLADVEGARQVLAGDVAALQFQLELRTVQAEVSTVFPTVAEEAGHPFAVPGIPGEQGIPGVQGERGKSATFALVLGAAALALALGTALSNCL